MDPIIRCIYIAYFNQDAMSVVGIPEDAKLASALQMMQHKAKTEMFNPWNPIRAHDSTTIRMALKFVRKYSTCENL